MCSARGYSSTPDAPPPLWLGSGTALLFGLFTSSFTGNAQWWLVGVVGGASVGLIAFGTQLILRHADVN
ncbi:hypothetical protein DMA15_30480 [Streptomyces sp. WAC 01529]|nr:hypothetical protein DMA15_30480 [Streptomyces sp. WAC 01529]